MGKPSIHQQRQEEMKNSTDFIKKEILYIEKFIEPFSLFNDNFKDDCLSLLNRRCESSPVRAYFIEKIFSYIQIYAKENKKVTLTPLFIQKLGFAFEVIIVIQYLHNQIIDGKYEITNQSQVNKNLICANLLKDALYLYIEDKNNIFKKNKCNDLLTMYIRRIFMYVDAGQLIEQKYNHYEQYLENKTHLFSDSSLIYSFTNSNVIRKFIELVKGDMKHQDKGVFIEIYFRRILLTNVSLFIIAVEILAKLTLLSEINIHNLVNFATCYGLVLQLVNDYSDFAYPNKLSPKEKELLKNGTVGKMMGDYFCDLRNKNITIVLIYHLDYSRNAQNHIDKYLNGISKKMTKYDHKMFINELLDSGSISKTDSLIKKIIKESKKYLEKSNSERAYLMDMINIGNRNKFKRIFDDFQQLN